MNLTAEQYTILAYVIGLGLMLGYALLLLLSHPKKLPPLPTAPSRQQAMKEI